MIDDFPESIMNKFLSGQRTPLLPIERADFDGVVHKDFARIRLQQTEDGLHPVFLPLIAKNNLEYFTEEQKTAFAKRTSFASGYIFLRKILKVVLCDEARTG